jgi:hypothetical protein
MCDKTFFFPLNSSVINVSVIVVVVKVGQRCFFPVSLKAHFHGNEEICTVIIKIRMENKKNKK